VTAFDRVTNTGDGNFDPTLAGIMAGTSSFICQDSLEIHSYGFATLSAATTDTCGATTASLRAFANG
jgi:hypothetical protein